MESYHVINIHIIGIQEHKKGSGAKHIFEEIVAKIFLNSMKTKNYRS